jgi:hypothetical protein
MCESEWIERASGLGSGHDGSAFRQRLHNVDSIERVFVDLCQQGQLDYVSYPNRQGSYAVTRDVFPPGDRSCKTALRWYLHHMAVWSI